MDRLAAIARVFVILVGFALFVVGMLAAFGRLGSDVVLGLGVAEVGLAIMVIAWKRVWEALLELLGPY